MNPLKHTARIGSRTVGGDAPTYVIAEISCNHNGDLAEAEAIVRDAAAAGADAVKVQTYRADTISRDFRSERFRLGGTMWKDLYTFDLYQKAHTPWEWHQRIFDVAKEHGLDCFSSPFDESAVDFLEELGAPLYKVASFEVVDLPLLRRIAATGKPVIMSTGMCTLAEIDEAVSCLREAGVRDLVMLHCNSGYPTRFEEVNLATMPVLSELYRVPVGLSDHTLWLDPDARERPVPHLAPAEAVRAGGRVVEVHLLRDREEAKTLFAKGEGGFDWPFSRTADELRRMVEAIRQAETGAPPVHANEEEAAAARALWGTVRSGPTAGEMGSRGLRPSLWVTRDVRAGDPFVFEAGSREPGNFDSIRPGGGLHTRFAEVVEGARATRDVAAGNPLEWSMVLRRD